MWRDCWKCKQRTNQRIKYLRGEKESYYEATCSCGHYELIAPYWFEQEKQIAKEERELRWANE